MVLDPRTVIFINAVYTLIIAGFIVSITVLEKYRFKGFANWIIAFILLFFNFLIISLKNIIPVSVVIILPHLLAVWAYIEIKRGLTRFYNVKNRIITDIAIIIVFAISLFTNPKNAQLRIMSVCLASMLVYLDIIILFNTKKNKEITNSSAIPFLFSMAAIVMTIRLVLGLQWDPKAEPLLSGNNLSTISILFFITNIIVFFTLFFIVINKMLDERNKLIAHIRSISLTDELTGMMNRRGFKNVTNYELNRFARTNKGFTFVICDIDDFKLTNDTYGHNCGDGVLKSVGDAIKANLRIGDTAARWGGEEFVILLPETNIEEAKIALARLNKSVENMNYECQDADCSNTGCRDVHINKTISIGACFVNTQNVHIDKVIEIADENLYNVKKRGKNNYKITEFND